MTPRSTLVAQQGAALMVALVLLLLMTMLGITSMKSATLEEQMAGNMADSSLAFQAAEAALNGAQRVVLAPDWDMTCSTCIKLANFGGVTDPSLWTSSNSTVYDRSLISVGTAPRYALESLGVWPCPGGSLSNTEQQCLFVRITARGTGGTNDAQVILQSTVPRRI